MIYFMRIGTASDAPIKIGYSADVPTRHRQLEAHYGQPLSLLAMVDGDRRTEAEIHRRFAAHRLGKTEQFKPGADLMAYIGRPLLVGANLETVEAMPRTPQDEDMALLSIKCRREWREVLGQVPPAKAGGL